MQFVLRYRQLMNVPELAPVAVVELFYAALSLEKPTLDGVGLAVDMRPESLTLQVDRQLIEQVPINLFNNAVEALAAAAAPRIRMTARLDHGRTPNDVKYNSPGIDEELMDQVFIPCFTNRREGGAIGLSLRRQIMTSHGGDIGIEPLPERAQVRLVLQ